jgi:anti-sigma factor RsiW
MNCQTIERLILEADDRPLDEAERRRLDEHLRACSACRAFEAGRAALRRGIREIADEKLPPALSERTRKACLDSLAGRAAAASPAAARRRVPVPVVVVSVLFTALATLWLAATLADVTPAQSLPKAAWVAVAFIVQNVLTLFVSPLVLRAARPAEKTEFTYR